MGLVRRAVHVAAGPRSCHEHHGGRSLCRAYGPALVEDDGLPVRQRRATVLPRQPILRSARTQRQESVLESREWVGAGGSRTRAGVLSSGVCWATAVGRSISEDWGEYRRSGGTCWLLSVGPIGSVLPVHP